MLRLPIILAVCLLFASSSVEAAINNATTTTRLSSSDMPMLDLLMVGNSRFSEAHNMEEMIQAMMEEHDAPVVATRYEVDKANMTRYASSHDLSVVLKERPWTWIVLQEENQIPGYCAGDPSRYHRSFNESLKSVVSLQQQIQANDEGTTTVLLNTWAYFEGDPRNLKWFPDYSTMQDKLTHGYRLYREHVLQTDPLARVRIAPAGEAFQRIYEDLVELDQDPLQPGSLFDQLYMPPSKHNQARKYPSLAGAYLCACVLFQTLLQTTDAMTGMDVRRSGYAPPGLSPEVRIQMQQVAYDTVVEFVRAGDIQAEEEEALVALELTMSAWHLVVAICLAVAAVLWLMGGGFFLYCFSTTDGKKKKNPGLAPLHPPERLRLDSRVPRGKAGERTGHGLDHRQLSRAAGRSDIPQAGGVRRGVQG